MFHYDSAPNSPELLLLSFLRLAYHSHFLAATLDFTSFFTINYCKSLRLPNRMSVLRKIVTYVLWEFQSVSVSLNQSVSRSINLSAHQSVIHIHPFIIQSANQLVSQPASHSVSQIDSQSVSQLVRQSVHH